MFLSQLFPEGTFSFLTIAMQCAKNDNEVDPDFEIKNVIKLLQ